MEQAKANVELARLTKERDLPLGEQHAIAQQIVDEAVQAHNARVADVSAAAANVVAAEANVNANHANVARLLQMQGFEQVLTSFDGTITQRNVAQGDLVKGGSVAEGNRKSTRLNSSHQIISYAVFCLKKKRAGGRFSH